MNKKPSYNILLAFGINGSLRKREVSNPQPYTEYYLFNSAANLKAYSNNGLDFAYYGYNAANTRAYKLSMLNQNQWTNGQPEPIHLQLQSAMFYPNAYINFNQNGEYTKHYYSGTERIASRLGDAQPESFVISSNDRLGFRIMQADQQARADLLELVEAGDVPIETPSVDVTVLQPTGTASDIFYYHMNHLGSTAFVTDQNQNVTQGFLYAPFGEITTEYNATFGNDVLPKYAFNAKELDEETGMYYYEARYYAPPVFVSRDPLFEKYPTFSPYTYCANNPIKYVDPTGEEIDIALEIRQNKYETVGQVVVYKNGQLFNKNADGTIGELYTGDSKYARAVQAQLNELKGKDKELEKVISELEKLNGSVHTISMVKSTITDNDVGPGITTHEYRNGCSAVDKKSVLKGKSTGSNINYNPYNNNSWQSDPVNRRPAIIGLAHELGHAFHFNEGDVILKQDKSAPSYSAFENQAIEIENIARKAYGLIIRPLIK